MDKDVERGIIAAIPNLRRYAFGLTGSWDAADDLTQDCLERAMRKSHLWRRRGSVRNWLFRILYHQFLNGRRSRAISLADGADVEAVPSDPMVSPGQDEQLACADVLRIVLALPHKQRVVVLLVIVEGYAYDEAAAILDVPIGTVRSRLARAREILEVALPRPRPAPKAGPQMADAQGEAPPRTSLRRVK